MPPTPSWIPMRWPVEWRDPALLDLLKRTPINCLILDWTEPKAFERLVGPARAAGLALVGLVPPEADLRTAARAAEAAGLAALAGGKPDASPLPFIRWTEKAALAWDSPASILAATDGLWPGVNWGQGGHSAGPTGLPWIDSNGWYVRLARERATGKILWMAFEPPKNDFVRTGSYILAIADLWVHGGRWVVALDAKLSAALAARGEIALEMWNGIAGALAFFKAREEWQELLPLGNMGVVSGFSGDDEYFAGEVLNLLTRRGVPYRVFLKDRAAGSPLESVRGIVYAGQEPPPEPLRKRLLAFVQAGGLLVVTAKWGAAAGAPASDTYRRFRVYTIGKGRLAVAKDEAPDPYLFSADAQLLLSHRNAPVRLFNAGTLGSYYTGSADGRRAVLHIINYAMRQFGHPVSVAFKRPYRGARIWTPGAPAPAALDLHPTLDRGVEVRVPPFPVYAAIELEA